MVKYGWRKCWRVRLEGTVGENVGEYIYFECMIGGGGVLVECTVKNGCIKLFDVIISPFR